MPEPIKLYEHQKKAAAILTTKPRFALYWEVGCGKTRAVLSGAEWSNKDQYLRTVVVCPPSVAVTAWANDASLYPFRLGQMACEPPQVRRRVIASDCDIAVVNFQVFAKHADELLRAGFVRLILDECSITKSHDTKITQALVRYAERCRSVILMSGTPAPGGDHQYWAQLRMMRPDVISPSFYSFAYKYFTPVKSRRPVPTRNPMTGEKTIQFREVIDDWQPKEGPLREEFLSILRSCSWALLKEDCLDLPPQSDLIREVILSGAEREAYDSAKETMRVQAKDGSIKRFKASNLANKLRQMCGGWLYAGEEKIPELFGSSKLAALDELLDEIGDKQCVIWVDFRTDAARVAALLAERAARPYVAKMKGGGSFAELHGGSSVDKAQAVASFQAGTTTYLVCHPGSVGHGVTMTAAHHDIWFTVPWSFELHEQGIGRTHRATQAQPVTHHYLLAKDTVDRRVLASVKAHETHHDGMMKLLSEELRVPVDALEAVPF